MCRLLRACCCATPIRILAALAVCIGLTVAATGPWQRRGDRQIADRSQYPTWDFAPGFENDVFTFVRIRYDAPASVVDGRWNNDYPDGDWNFSWRLQQLTSLNVDPNGKVLRFDDPELLNHPFAYVLGIRDMWLSDAEVEGLRRYLLNGGFLWVDDFWTQREWDQLYGQMKRVLPGREPRELTFEHPIFHIVYDLAEMPQVPSIQAWRRGWTFEYWHGDTGGDEDPHYYGYFDDDGRMIALATMNNDIGDGWEREGEETEYFHLYSEKWSYPMGINIITYALTH